MPKLFEVEITGDPYSRAWICREFKESFDERFCIYRGDLSGLYGKTRLIATLRRMYPGCKIRVVR